MENDSIAESSQTKADELEERLINFAVRIIKLSANLPNTPAGKHIAGQILRSGTSPVGGEQGTVPDIHFVAQDCSVEQER